MPTVNGRNARPVCSGDQPDTFCRTSDMKKNIANIAAGVMNIVTKAIERARSANRLSGISGLRTERSTSTNATRRAAPPISASSV